MNACRKHDRFGLIALILSVGFLALAVRPPLAA
jgi:hypothetical protein